MSEKRYSVYDRQGFEGLGTCESEARQIAREHLEGNVLTGNHDLVLCEIVPVADIKMVLTTSIEETEPADEQHVGRPPSLSSAQQRIAKDMVAIGGKVEDVAGYFGISESAIYRLLKA